MLHNTPVRLQLHLNLRRLDILATFRESNAAMFQFIITVSHVITTVVFTVTITIKISL